MREAENPRPPQKGEQHTQTQKTKQKQKKENKTKQKENKQTNKHDSYRRWRLAEECSSFFRLPKRRAAIVVTPVIRTYKGNLRLLIIISEI